MAATTTQPIKALAKKIEKHFLAYAFTHDEDFWWSSQQKVIYRPAITDVTAAWTLLHEIAHAELKHTAYTLDIDLLAQEVGAWEHARLVLAPRFGLQIGDDHIQDHLDTYRRWLHERSRCPECEQNAIQATQNTYNCTNCRCLWRVNDARGCALRRVKL